MRTAAESLGDRVRQLLKAEGISQTAIGDVLGLSQVAISRRLRGHVDFTIPELDRIADALNTPLNELLRP